MFKNGIVIVFILTVMCSCKKRTTCSDIGSDYKDGVVVKELSNYKLGFTASGHDPEWKVELMNNVIVYSDIRLAKPIKYKWIESYLVEEGTVYIGGDSIGDTIRIQFIKHDCRDIFEDYTRPFQVNVTRNSMSSESGERGCGMYTEDPRLEGRWLIHKMNGTKMKKTNNGNFGEITFNIQAHSIGTQISCNSMGGSYVLQENVLHISENMMTTLMMCNKDMALEEELAATLAGKSITYSFIDENILMLRSKDKVVLELKKAK
jgi:heat shock protein HslJ